MSSQDGATPGLAAVEHDPFAQPALARVVPTTEPQREVWLASQIAVEASLAFNEAVSLRLSGPLDLGALQSALHALVGRHEALRSTFGVDGRELLIAESQALPLAVTDLSERTPALRDEALAATLDRVVVEPFDLAQGPLMRAELLRLDAAQHVLVLTAHHIVCDGWSFGVVVKDLAVLYAAQVGGWPPGPADSFGDYAIAQAGASSEPALAQAESYWLSRFTGELPVLDLPTDRPRPVVREFTSGRVDRVLGAQLAADLKRAGAKRGASLFASLLAGFGALLSRLSGQTDVVVGIAAAGQAGGGHDSLVGHCVNTLPVRLALDPAAPFATLLDSARTHLLDAFEHQGYTFGTLLRKLPLDRDPGRLPLVSVLFNLDQPLDPDAINFPGLRAELRSVPRAYENFELFVSVVPVEGTLRIECQHNRTLFDAETVARWLEAYETLLLGVVAEASTPIAALRFVSAQERARLDRLQPATSAYDATRPVHALVEAQAAATPDRIAVRFQGRTLRYRELDESASRIAHALRALGIRRGARVGLLLPRGSDMLVGLLGVLKAGGTYIPLDPAYPRDRLNFMLGDAGLATVLTDAACLGLVDWPRERALLLDADAEAIAASAATPLPADADAAAPETAAYVIYTSGSTGKPKGVQVPHRAVVNFLLSMRNEPGIGPDDRLVAVTTLSFDIAVLELLLPLSIGAQVVVATRDDAMDGQALSALLAESGATIMQATPATWRLLIDAGWRGGPAFKALCGGEALPADLAVQLLARSGELWNMYGPTETTVWSTCSRVARPESGISIGRPIANTTVWVLDDQRRPCPVGVPGELCIGGDGVALGYLDRPELTADRFIPDPFDTRPGARLYRTGDRGRWLANGTLAHLGRMDFQVKLRGFRIELGEIESRLSADPGVARSIAIVREDRPGDQRLVAYVVMREGHVFDEQALRAHLKSALPEHMLPAHLVELGAIPQLPNGKVDRKGLPAPDSRSGAMRADHVAPRNDLERAVAAEMESVLALPDLGVDDNFFQLGGHSLLAAQLTSRLSRQLDLAIPLRVLFEAPTIARLAARVQELRSAAGGAAAAHRIQHLPNRTRAPLSMMQERLWLLEQVDPGRITYNTPSAHRLRGKLDEVAFERALIEMVRRQASLRTSIEQGANGPVQVVHDAVELGLFPAEDLSALAPAEREAALGRRIEELTSKPFDLARAPLFRAHMFRLAPEEHALFFMAHHIIWDGWCFDLLYDELSALYAAFHAGRTSPLADLPVQYGDFAAWHGRWLEGEEYARQLDYWRELLSRRGEPEALAADRPRRPGMSGSGRVEWLTVPKDITEALHKVARQSDATLFMVLLAVYYALLHQCTGQREFVVGTPVRGRHLVELEPVMGFFVNLLTLPMAVDPSQRFVDFVERVRAAVLDGFSHPDVPLEQLMRQLSVRQGSAGSQLYQALFSFQDVRARATHWGNLVHERIRVRQPGATEDLGAWFVENASGLTGGLVYNADIFFAETAQRIRDRFLALLERVAKHPTLPIADLIAMPPAEQALLAQWNATGSGPGPAAALHELIDAQAARSPSRRALRSGSQAHTYQELVQRANRIAHCLRARGVRRGAHVGLFLDRGFDMLAALLGVLKAGGSYIPLDAAHPRDRLNFMIQDAGLDVLVTDAERLALVDWPRERSLMLDADGRAVAAADVDPLPAGGERAGPNDVACVIYTSGSTGKPKGVQIPHRAVVNFLESMRRAPALGPDDRLVAVSTPAFDLALLELLLPLTVGAEVVIANRDQAMDGRALKLLLAESKATTMQATPATWRRLIDADWRGEPKFKALCGGEALTTNLATELVARCSEVWNMYGQTETTSWSTCWRVERPEAGISIGRPIANTTVWVLDEQGRQCPIGVPGELCIGGDGVAHGYLGQPERTAARFIPDPFDARPGTRLFRTGDRGRWLSNGTLEHHGGREYRVQLRGFRIDVGGIERVARQEPDVSDAIAMVRDMPDRGPCLVLYVTSDAVSEDLAVRLRRRLTANLPHYSQPQFIERIARVPLTLSGKVDRHALPEPVLGGSDEPPAGAQSHKDSAKLDPREALLMEIWRDLLGNPEIGPSDNFFEVGGHSLMALTMIGQVEARSGVRLNLLNVATNSLRALAIALPADLPQARSTSPKLSERMRRFFGLGQRKESA
jgi:amino acid adenylation domain-containing protein